MPQITVFGSLNMDLVVRVARLPQPGETILGGDYQSFPGGKGANQAVAAARLGARVTMLGRVGADAFGERLRSALQQEGANVEAVTADPAAATGVALITVEPAGRNTIVVAPGANMAVTPGEVRAALESIAAMDALILQLESPVECVLEAARIAHRRGARVILNPAPARPLPGEIFAAIDVLAPNETEASLLTGKPAATLEQAAAAGRALLQAGARSVVITLGERGALIVEPGRAPQHLPAHAVQAVDTTAAGDAFVAALTVGLAEGLPLTQAARLGNAAGALAATRRGAQPSLPTREEVWRLVGGG